MILVAELRRRSGQAIAPLLGLMAVTYFAYHTVQGDRGLLAWWQLNREIHSAETTLASLQAERDGLERRARLLRPDHLDPDMLEERARLMLDLGRDDDVIVFRSRPAP